MPTNFLTGSMAAQPACTYCVLELGIARTSLPCDAGAQVGTGPPMRCHVTLGYLPPLTPAGIKRAVYHGRFLVNKFLEDGDLPIYTHRPHECDTAWGNGFLRGLCRYEYRKRQSFSLMRYADIGVKEPIGSLNAEFDHIHVKGGFIVGSLTKECNVHVLVNRLRSYVENEVLGQYGNEPFLLRQHRWSKPHITLAKP